MEFYTQAKSVKTKFNPVFKALALTAAHSRRLRRQRRKAAFA